MRRRRSTGSHRFADQQIAAKQAELKHEHAPAGSPAAGSALVKCDCGAEIAAGVKFCSVCGKKAG
jgi:hypothetical protein